MGKSSLISTFVSRHFSEVVPGIMTRVRLPPDPENSCITTIVDSQGGDAALMSAVATMSMPGGGGASPAAMASSLSSLQQSFQSSSSAAASNHASNLGGIENVDSIVLIYDLDREETFFRLENHWLPLIERCYNGDVSKDRRIKCGSLCIVYVSNHSLLFTFRSHFCSYQSSSLATKWINSFHLVQQVSPMSKYLPGLVSKS